MKFTCCKSSLSDFNCATKALMQPFIEHKVAYLKERKRFYEAGN